MPEPKPLPPIATQPLSVVLLAHNDRHHLEVVVAEWLAFLSGLGRDFELIVVDDGSSDGTADLKTPLRTDHPRVHFLRHAAPQGEGAALRTALAVARHPLLAYAPCDPRYPPGDLSRLLSKRTNPAKPDLEIDHVHVMSGYRAGLRVPLFWRALGALGRVVSRVVFSHAPAPLPGWLGWRRHVGGLVVRWLFGVRYRDVASPFRLVRREIFQRIPLQSDGPFVHVEIVAKANFLGHVLGEEVPLQVPPGPRSAPVGGSARELLAEAVRLFRHAEFGPPAQPQPQPKAVPPSAVGGESPAPP
jgi:glycosyltransferase involved in cell wall biosynthesis